MLFSFVYEYLDQVRRYQGDTIEALYAKPMRSKCYVIASSCTWSLLSYGEGDYKAPVLLIIPAPIKRGYIWDLSPSTSVVKTCLDAGLQIYRMEWKAPDADSQSCNNGLSSYAKNFLIDSVGVVLSHSGASRIFLAGHSLGGTLAAIFSSLYPERIKGLLLASAPTSFSRKSRRNAQSITQTIQRRVPGSYLSSTSYLNYPITLGFERLIDFIKSIFDPALIRSHMLALRWTLDEFPMPERLFTDVINKLYIENSFIKGNLMLEGKIANPMNLTMPVLSIIEPRSLLVPSNTMLPLHHFVRNPLKRLLWYEGDTGVALQHIGALIGKSAIRRLWPQAILWMKTVWN